MNYAAYRRSVRHIELCYNQDTFMYDFSQDEILYSTSFP